METKEKKNKITSGNNPLEKKLTCPKSVVVCQGLLHALLPSTLVCNSRQTREKKIGKSRKKKYENLTIGFMIFICFCFVIKGVIHRGLK